MFSIIYLHAMFAFLKHCFYNFNIFFKFRKLQCAEIMYLDHRSITLVNMSKLIKGGGYSNIPYLYLDAFLLLCMLLVGQRCKSKKMIFNFFQSLSHLFSIQHLFVAISTHVLPVLYTHLIINMYR